MEFKGTKGKWIVDIRDTRCCVSIDDNKAICDVWGYDVSSVTKTEMQANAKLIAAAPEMFEMLKELLQDIDELTTPTSMNNTIFRAEQLLTKITE